MGLSILRSSDYHAHKTPFRVLMCRLTQFMSMPVPTLHSSAPFQHLHSHRRHSVDLSYPKLANLPSAKGLWFRYCPPFFKISHFGPLRGVTGAHLCAVSMKYRTSTVFFEHNSVCRPAQLIADCASLISSSIFGPLKGLSPQSLGGIGLSDCLPQLVEKSKLSLTSSLIINLRERLHRQRILR